MTLDFRNGNTLKHIPIPLQVSPIINPVRAVRYNGHEQDFVSEIDLELHSCIGYM